jgi:membrane protease YdiL (CAAX protease family)
MIATFGAALVLAWVRASGTPWRDIGYVRPGSWIGGIAVGLMAGAVFKLVMKAVVMPLLGADPVNHTYQYLTGNPAMLVPAVLLMLAAGFGEETVFRGFLFERLGKLFGAGAPAKIAIVLITTAAFASLHYPDQGWAGAEQAIFTGLAFGTTFALTGRLWTLMWAHAGFDLTALALIYWNLEPAVAHAFFM